MSPTPTPASLAAELKRRAMAIDAELGRRLRAADQLSFRLLHDVRLATKRLRAWWLLARPLAGKSPVRTADARLAAAARLLAPMRDAYVMRRLVGRLARQAERPGDRSALDAGTRQLTVAGPEGVATPAFPAMRETLLRAFASDAAAWRRLPIAPDVDAAILEEMADAYRRARRRGRRAGRRRSPKDLHAWRKWVKAHQAHVEFLRAARGRRVLALHFRDLLGLSRQLGRSQDLAVLDGWFDWRASAGAVSRRDARRMHAYLDRRRTAARGRSERLGRRVFAEKAGAFALRLYRAAGVPVADE